MLHFSFPTLAITENIARKKHTEINVSESKSDFNELDSEHAREFLFICGLRMEHGF